MHTAAASNLGQMLNRICLKDGIGLVNIVRKPEQAALLREQSAQHVCVSTSPGFIDELTAAVATTGATLAFDAVGGSRLASQILGCMERPSTARRPNTAATGPPVHKQVYLYGMLDPSPTEIVRRNAGMAWGVGGWFAVPVPAESVQRRRRHCASAWPRS